MINGKTIERVNDAIQIDDVVGAFVDLKKAGASLKACCPFHDEKTPSFVVSPSRGIFKCFGCGKGGDSITFIMEHQGKTYPDAIRWLADRYKIEVEEHTGKPDANHTDREIILATLSAAQAHFTTTADTKPKDDPARAYWKGRGFTDETLDAFGIGYCPGLAAKPIDSENLIKAGIANEETGNLSLYKRSTIPIHNWRGQLVSFAGRAIVDKKGSPKYINGRDTATYSKSNTLYNLHRAAQAIRKTGDVWIVEGYADAMAMHQAGTQNVVALCGTALTDAQVAQLKRFNGETKLRILLALDNEVMPDRDGFKPQVEKALISAIRQLLTLGEVQVVQYPSNCKDMADVVAAGKFDEQSLIGSTEDAIDWFVKNKWSKGFQENATAVQKAEFQESAAQLISAVKWDTVRDIYVKSICSILELGAQRFEQLVRKYAAQKEIKVTNRQIQEFKHVKVCDMYMERQPKPDPITGTISFHYVGRKKDEIKDEFGLAYLRRIPRFTNWILKPEHLNYERVVKVAVGNDEYQFFNRYEPLSYEPKAFELPSGFYEDPANFDYEKIPEIENTARFFKHIYDHAGFGNKFMTIGWDYLALMYLYPTKRLPAQALVSKEEGTGKSTLINYYLQFFGVNATPSEATRIAGKFNSLYSGKIVVCVEETKDERGGLENMLKELITSYAQVVERKGIDATVEHSFQKFIFASNHETSFMKVGTETTRFFVMKVKAIQGKIPDFEQKLFMEIPYVMHFLKKRMVITPEQDRLWFHPDLLVNEALQKLRDESKDIVQHVMEDLISSMFLRTEYDKPIIRLTSNYLRSLMIAFGGKTYEKPPKYFQKVAADSMQAPYINMPLKMEMIYIPKANGFDDLSVLETWQYEARVVSGRYLLFPIWKYVTPQSFLDNYTAERAKILLDRIQADLDEINKYMDAKEAIKWYDAVVNLMDGKPELVKEKAPF